MMRLLPAFSVFLAACSAAVSGGPPSDALEITGELAYRQRIALPPSGEVVVMLQEVAANDPANDIVGSQHIALTGQQVPIPFKLTIPRSALNPSRRYVVRATIRDADQRLLWTTERGYAVDPAVRGIHLNTLNLVPPSATARSGIAHDVAWTITAINGAAPVAGSEPSLRFGGDERVSVKTGCNGMSGSVTVDGALITISRLTSTMMACAEPLMAQESTIARILGAVQQWRETDGVLTLSGPEGTISATR